MIISICCILFSCDDIIEVDDISQEEVTILAPVNSAVLNDNSVIFSWEAVEFAETYTIQIATPTFSEALQIVEDSTLTATNFTRQLPNADYEWRVRAENSGYTTNYTLHQFSIED